MEDIITIGDSTEDVFLKVEEAKVHCSRDKQNCQLCFTYASKIPVKRLDRLIGGNSSNAVIGSSRLGLKSALYTEIGDDLTGKRIIKILKENKVGTKYVKINNKTSTNYSVVINLGAERTILIYHEKRVYKLPRFDKSKWIYLSSMGKGCDKIYSDLVNHIRKNKIKLAFNPGTHQINQGVKKLNSILKLTTVLCLNKEEYQELLKNKSSDYKILLKEMYKLGPKICVLTDGSRGACVYDGSEFYSCKIFDVPVVERTGCGDSFFIAFVCALYYGNEIKEAMRWGIANSASVVQYIGSYEGLLNLNGMKRYCDKFKHIKCVKI